MAFHPSPVVGRPTGWHWGAVNFLQVWESAAIGILSVGDSDVYPRESLIDSIVRHIKHFLEIAIFDNSE